MKHSEKKKRPQKVYDLFDQNDRGMVVVFTDGSCVDNGTESAEGGIGVYFPFGDYHNISTHYDASMCAGESVTNQKCEIAAVIVALETLRQDARPVRVYTDSIYVTNMWTKWFPTWKHTPETVVERKNLSLVNRLMGLLAQKDVQVFHVNAHTRFVEEIRGDRDSMLANVVTKCNRIADQLSQIGKTANLALH